MMTDLILIWLTVLQAPAPKTADQLIREIASTGRVVELAEAPSQRIAPPERIAPGAPPLLSFRFFEGRDRHRFGKLDLVMDDAGH